MEPILIYNGTIINEGRRFVGYVVVDNGIIAEIGEGAHPCPERLENARKIDATGRIVMPGAIDGHVHFREPGPTVKGDMASESAAAVAGGVTSVLEMPNTIPTTTTIETLTAKFELARGRMHTNYSFFLGAANDNWGEISAISGGKASVSGANSAIPGVKLFMGSSTGGMLVEDAKTLERLFAEWPGIIVAHCEDEAIIRSDTELYRKRLGDSATAAAHPSVRSAEACLRATARAVELADKYGSRLHVAHLTTARELSLFDARPLCPTDPAPDRTCHSAGPDVGSSAIKRITAEVCVPHLWFSDGDYARLGNRIKCNPAIKSAEDRTALQSALCNGRADTVATDHAPHLSAEKALPYWNAPSGIPSVGHSVPLMFTLASRGVFTLETVVEKMCHAPARLFGIARRGFLRRGYIADIAIVDPAEEWTVGPGNILYKCGWSPWKGEKLTGRVTHTIVCGTVVYDGGNVSPAPVGEQLKFV